MRSAPVGAPTKIRSLGTSRSSLYYRPKLPEKDAFLRRDIERVLRDHPSYGHKRIARHLGINKKRVRRVMQLFGLKPYRRRGQKWRRMKPQNERYPNLLRVITPITEGVVWAADFTHLAYKGKDVCMATVIDIFSRRVVGTAVSTNHATPLVLQAFANAILSNSRPAIFHSDNGSEYHSKPFRTLLATLGISISRSQPGCPWENGYQESFYNQFKVDLGDPNRFASLGELTAAIYETIYRYNTDRIHSALRMSPTQFAWKHNAGTIASIV
ncbi:IS3 family transposase [Candidatus Uhrbacteria bacterium]|nr:IS3 family transposase [Candidatus Uhrbacteria bacterium]